jgi:hypothetical protein
MDRVAAVVETEVAARAVRLVKAAARRQVAVMLAVRYLGSTAAAEMRWEVVLTVPWPSAGVDQSESQGVARQ